MITLSNIAPAFSFILANGLIPGTGDYKPHEFGNANLVAAGTPFSLRFERDRGQVFVEIGGKNSRWYKLEYVLEFVDHSISQEELGTPPDPAILSKLLEQHWLVVTKLFNDPNQVAILDDFAARKSAVLLSAIFGKPEI